MRLATFGVGPSAPQSDPDEKFEPQHVAISMSGDIWLLGKHRVMCGNSTTKDDVAKLMDGELADLCFTSPPYGDQRDYGRVGRGSLDWDALMHGVFQNAPMKPAGQILVNLGLIHRDGEWMPYWDGWIDWMRSVGWRRFGWYVWDQGPGLPGDWNGRLAPSFEFIFHFRKQTFRANKSVPSKLAGIISNGGLRELSGAIGGRTKGPSAIQPFKIPDSVIRVTRHKGAVDGGEHPAVFPVGLPQTMHEAYSKPGEIAYEPFCGSGSQIIAAELTGRVCHAVEIEPRYVDVAVRRWQNFTGKKAMLQGTKKTFDQIEKERSKAAA